MRTCAEPAKDFESALELVAAARTTIGEQGAADRAIDRTRSTRRAARGARTHRRSSVGRRGGEEQAWLRRLPHVGGAAQTWHYGLIAKWWAEFNDDFRPHEIPYFQRYIERDGQPALDVACGTGRLLLPYLRAGLDVDGCDVSGDMIALCREKAEREGLSPNLWAQPMHALEPPRTYRTIYVCGAFGLGSTREQDFESLRRFRECLEPG